MTLSILNPLKSSLSSTTTRKAFMFENLLNFYKTMEPWCSCLCCSKPPLPPPSAYLVQRFCQDGAGLPPPGSCTAEIRGMHLIWNNKDPPSSTGGRSHPGGRDEQGGPMALLVWGCGHGRTNHIPGWGYTYKQLKLERTQAMHTILNGPKAARTCIRAQWKIKCQADFKMT